MSQANEGKFPEGSPADVLFTVPAVEVLWGSHRPPKRGPKPKLSREQIVATGIDIADSDGLTALSMQRIADTLGYTKMSLYRYTPGRAELIAIMFDTAIGPPPDLSEIAGGWREQLKRWAECMLGMYSQHPWTIEASIGPRVFGPQEMAWLETGLACLSDLELSGGEQLDTIVLVNGHVRSLAQQIADSDRDNLGVDLSAAMAPIINEHRDTYPHVSAAFTAAATDKNDNAFTFGISRILDGLEALVDSRN